MTDVEADAATAAHLRRAAEHAPIGIICVNGATGQWVFVNDSFVRMLQRSRDEVLATDPFELMHNATHPDDRAADLGLIERVAQGEMDTCRHEKRLFRKDGSPFWVAAEMLASRDAAGRLAHLTVYFTDIEAQRAAKDVRDEL